MPEEKPKVGRKQSIYGSARGVKTESCRFPREFGCLSGFPKFLDTAGNFLTLKKNEKERVGKNSNIIVFRLKLFPH